MNHAIKKLVKPTAFITVAGVSLICFSHLTPPLLNLALMAKIPFLKKLPYDLNIYFFRFFLSFIFLGIIPYGVARFCGEKNLSLGIFFPVKFMRTKAFLLLLVLLAVIGITSAYLPGLFKYYPYSHKIREYVRNSEIGFLFLHYALYIGLYYIPWEFFFRSFLIFPFLHMTSTHSHKISPHNRTTTGYPSALSFAIASLPILPSLFLHIGHPPSELVGVILVGFLFGYLALKTGSIVPGLILHCTIGVFTDTAIILRDIGVFPG